jgi:hypothetical protein
LPGALSWIGEILMNSLLLSAIIFALVIGGILFGALLRHKLPHHHLSKDSQDVVRLGVGLIATIAALVLGLMIASAKSSFDTQSGQVKQITADVILADNLLAEYGPEALPIRQHLREVIAGFAARLWHEKQTRTTGRFESNAASEQVYLEMQALVPKTEVQKSLQARIVEATTDIAHTRLLLFAESDNAIPPPFIVILVFWLVIIFASFSLFAEINITTFSFLAVFALSASCALYLILEMSQPFAGLMQIPSAPLRDALAPLVS